MNLVLKKFMIFNSSEGQDEGKERDKLLYHWTKGAGNAGKVEVNEQIDDICLCDASIGASTRLGSQLVCNDDNDERNLFTESQESGRLESIEPDACLGSRHLVLTFDTTVIVIVEIEPASTIWIAVHVSQAQTADSNDHSTHTSTTQLPDSESIPTDAIRRVIKNIYTRFCLINGTFQMITNRILGIDCRDPNSKESQSAIREGTRDLCDNYFSLVLPEIHLSSSISNIASLYNQLTYLDLNPLTLMRVTSFINHLVCLDPRQIRHTIAIYNDQLLWSSLNAFDSRLVFNYMVGVLIRDALQEELSRETEKVRRIKDNMPIYLMESLATLEQGISSIRVGTDQAIQLQKFYLTVFRSSNNMTLGLIFNEADQFDLTQKCEQILTSDSRLGVIPLASLAKSVGQSFLKATTHLTGTSATSSNQQGSSTTNSSLSKRRQSAGNLSLLRNSIPIDQKYLCLDRLDLSVSSSFSLDAPSRDHGHSTEGSSNETTSNRKLKLLRYMIELEPELKDIHAITGRRVEEYLARTIGDTWLTVINSKYRCIYTVYRARNAGLNEAQQAANNLRVALLTSRI